jgi:hypothetical protein
MKRLKKANDIESLIKQAYEEFSIPDFIDYYFEKGKYEENNKKNNKNDMLKAIDSYIPLIDKNNEEYKNNAEEIAGYIDYDLYYKIQDYILNDIDKKEYFVSPELGDLQDLIANNKDVPLEELEKSNEPIGTQFFTLRLDTYNRDYPFIIINNDIVIKGKNGQTHTESLADYAESQKDDEDFEFLAEELEGLSQREDSIELIEETLDISSLCFGHVKGNLAFIDVVSGKMSESLPNLVKSELGVKKVYVSSDDYESRCLNTRVARLKH